MSIILICDAVKRMRTRIRHISLSRHQRYPRCSHLLRGESLTPPFHRVPFSYLYRSAELLSALITSSLPFPAFYRRLCDVVLPSRREKTGHARELPQLQIQENRHTGGEGNCRSECHCCHEEVSRIKSYSSIHPVHDSRSISRRITMGELFHAVSCTYHTRLQCVSSCLRRGRHLQDKFTDGPLLSTSLH